ncbi:MAG: hypothetical protein K6G75_03745 [Lachnospiraceae bacterium]|nr:hypothetical protein [Lachnospiraceae bacterium]
MKHIKYFAVSLGLCLSFLMPLTACGNPVDDACDTVEDMAEQKDNTKDALDDFHQNADDKEAEADAILDMVE